MSETKPMMSGHCSFPQTAEPRLSHERCTRNGAGSKANPRKEFFPCPCQCHFAGEQFQCECGDTLAVAPYLGLDDDGDDQYVHLDHQGRMTSMYCR